MFSDKRKKINSFGSCCLTSVTKCYKLFTNKISMKFLKMSKKYSFLKSSLSKYCEKTKIIIICQCQISHFSTHVYMDAVTHTRALIAQCILVCEAIHNAQKMNIHQNSQITHIKITENIHFLHVQITSFLVFK